MHNALTATATRAALVVALASPLGAHAAARLAAAPSPHR